MPKITSYLAATKAQQQPDDEKLRELIIYIATLSGNDPKFGAVKLNKLLFYSDFLAYRNFGKAITGQPYQALPEGPAPRRMKPLVERMKGRDIRQERRRVGSFEQIRVVPLRAAVLSQFSGPEIDLVHEVIRQFWNMNATEISDQSHLFVGWQAGITGETIPYSTVLIGDRKPTAAEERYGRALQKAAREALAGVHR